jgi:intracellular sulfur oxidation DsrE/DsrF family protein
MRNPFMIISLLLASYLMADGVAQAVTTEAVQPSIEPSVSVTPVTTRYQAFIQRHNAEELFDLLQRAETIASGQLEYSTSEPIPLVLTGEEIELFKRENYRDNKSLIDMAARLEAFNVVDIKVCRRWLGDHGIEMTDLPSFIDGVVSGEFEVKRLQQAGYTLF